MKLNCMMFSAKGIFKAIFPNTFGKSIEIEENGDLRWNDDKGRICYATANECAYELCMPLWEVITTVDEIGCESNGYLFYED